MAAPLVPLAYAGASVGSSLMSGWAGGHVSALSTAALRGSTYHSNVRNPNVVPTPDAAIAAWSKGLISRSRMILIGLLHGAVLGDPQQVEEALRTDTTLTAQERTQFRDAANRLRMASAFWAPIMEAHRGTLSPGEVMSAYASGIVLPTEVAALVTRGGGDPDHYWSVRQAYEAVPTIGPLYEARWRGLITPERFDYWLRRQGHVDPQARQIMAAGLEALPPISDVITFSVREVFSPDVSVPAGYWNEFPDEVLQWAAKQGLGWETGLRRPVNGVDTNTTPAHWYWAAHWQPISPTQSYEMLHRLRPGRVTRYERMISTPDNPNPRIEPFTMDDVQRWLRVSDYPPSVRNQLAAISFSVMRLVDIRAVFKLIPNRRQWAIEQLLDRGYVQEDATQTVDLWARQNADSAQRQARREEDKATAQLVKQARESYRLGVVTREALRASLTAVGFASAAIDAVISVEDNESRLSIIRATIARVRQEVRNGNLEFDRAVTLLTRAGIGEVQARAEALRAVNSITTRRQQATTAQIQRWVSRGTMTAAEGQRRLRNLGWENADIALLVGESVGNLNQLRAKLAAQAAQANQRRIKGVEGARKEAIKLRQQAESALRRIAPVGVIKKLLEAGIISERRAISRLSAQGYPPQAIAEYLALWRQERGEKNGQAKEAEETTGQQSPTDTGAAGPASAGG